VCVCVCAYIECACVCVCVSHVLQIGVRSTYMHICTKFRQVRTYTKNTTTTKIDEQAHYCRDDNMSCRYSLFAKREKKRTRARSKRGDLPAERAGLAGRNSAAERVYIHADTVR
jgi:hypothetical protein